MKTRRSSGIGAATRRITQPGTQRSCETPRPTPAIPPRPRRARRLVLAVCLVHVALAPRVSAEYSLNWATLDGGGGISTGGVYSVSATIGRPDASTPLTNEQYSATGGFWVLPTVVTSPGAPRLTVAGASPGFAMLSWTPDTPGWVLQESDDAASTNWVDSPSGSTNPIVVPATLPVRFYRLFRP